MALRPKKYKKRVREWASPDRRCVMCDKQFTPTSSRHKTCCKRCSQLLGNLNKRIRSGGSLEPRKAIPKGDNVLVHRKLRVIESRASRKSLTFSLTVHWWESQWRAQQGRCAMTGFPMQFSGEKLSPWTVSIDRIVPELGYVPDNCRMVCFRANEMRGNMNDAEFRVWLTSLLHGLNWREGVTDGV